VTTYLSLPGRYCVLMPNSPRGGGVSRKIASIQERRRMRELLSDLEVPEGMSVILRTAGVSRTKVEIKRDLDYLTRLWDNIRELTLESTAPALVHEEGNLIRRAIRDIYGRDIEDVVVAGEEGFKTARDFM
jgi:ribonuclease E